MTVRAGRYELLRAIASGGMATVHLGRALGEGGFERLVAVKVMHAHLAEEPEFVAMFLDEARLAARIRHPNVVSTIDIQRDEQGLFLVMEYVEGPSLQRVLRALAKQQRGTLPLGLALRIFVDTLAGLHAAHELCGPGGESLNLVHRDVSPQNVLIGSDGVARITDFGVARAESRLQTTRGNVVKGKVCYMAPEQIRSEPIDRRTDVYAAGALLWEVLIGQRLVRGDNEGGMMQRIVAGQHPAPRDVNSSVPEAISTACMRALSASPDDRYPTAAAFAEAVENAAESDGVTIASTRALSVFIKELGIERADSLSTTSPSGSLPSGVPLPSSQPRERAVSAATAAAVPAPLPDQTNAAVLAPSHMAKPRRAGALRWAVGGGLVILAGVVWLVTLGPLRISWGEASPQGVPTARAAQAAASSPTSAGTATPVVVTPAPDTTPAPATAAPPASASAPSQPSATAAASKGPAPKVERRNPGTNGAAPSNPASPTTFRPKDL